jgi:hypothetical protein
MAGEEFISSGEMTTKYARLANTYTNVTIGIAIQMARGKFLGNTKIYNAYKGYLIINIVTIMFYSQLK